MDPQQGPPQPDLLIGQTIGNYLVTQKLGEGGMGSVYLAEHPSIGKKVALKVLHSEFSTNQEVAARFFHEAKAVNDIGHPNIVDIVDFGILQSGGGREQLVYFIMEYLAGLTLSQLIRGEAPLPPERALTIGLQVADALSASHKCGIVHRDLKPDNIILLQRGRERDFVKLLDFGIAKLTGGSAVGSHRTRTGIVMGTPAYMSPEQCEGRGSVDLRTDVYALGIVMYEMLTGRVPFLGEGYGEILVQHLTRPPAPPSQYRMLSPHVEVVVMKALEKRPDMRYPTMEELMRAMSDPVGYVEANGGVGGFLHRPLVPSTGPMPSGIRLTPAPPTLAQLGHPTPLPGTIVASRTGSGAATAPGGTGTPTTLGSASAQIQAQRSKSAYVAAAIGVIVAAAIAIVLVVAKGKGPDAARASGSLVDDRSEASRAGLGSDPGVAANPTGSGSAIAGSGTMAGTPAAGASRPDAGSDTAGSGSATATAGDTSATGSNAADGSANGTAGSDPVPATDITVTSVPARAKILVDGVESGKLTPSTLTIPKGKRVEITLRLRGYEPYAFKPVQGGASSDLNAELVKSKSSTVPTCRGPQRAGCARDARGCCLPDSTGTGSGRANGSGSRSPTSDPDGLMTP